MGQTVNLLVYTFGGSNPSSPTQRKLTRKPNGDAARPTVPKPGGDMRK